MCVYVLSRFSHVWLFATLWLTRLHCPWDFQARILEWVAISFCRGSSRPRDGTCVSCIGRQFFTNSNTWEAQRIIYNELSFTCCPRLPMISSQPTLFYLNFNPYSQHCTKFFEASLRIIIFSPLKFQHISLKDFLKSVMTSLFHITSSNNSLINQYLVSVKILPIIHKCIPANFFELESKEDLCIAFH